MKRVLFLIITVFAVLFGSTALAQDLKVSVNGEILETDAVLVENRTMVPLRAISNALGGGVAWDQENMGILIVRGSAEIQGDGYLGSMWVDKPRAFCFYGSGISHGTVMDVAPLVIENRTYVPARAISELFGADVNWNPDTFTAEITAPKPLEVFTDEIAESVIHYEQASFVYYDVYDRYLNGETEKVKAEIILENDKKIVIELYPEIAPITVANFVKLASDGFYNGLTFHRAIENFVIQGGGFDKDDIEKQAAPIPGEFLVNNYINFMPHKRGTLSMARTAVDYNSASSQFFIVHQDSFYLDGKYASFGMVTEGMELVDDIARTETDETDKPVNDIIIKEINIIEVN